MEKTKGVVTNLLAGNFTIKTASATFRLHHNITYHGTYLCPQVQFICRQYAGDTGKIITITPESKSLRDEYMAGDSIGVLFKKNDPESALLYSPGEFWFVPSYMIILGTVTMLSYVVFFVIVFKPWKLMD